MCTNYVFDADKGAQTNANKHKWTNERERKPNKHKWTQTNMNKPNKHEQKLNKNGDQQTNGDKHEQAAASTN